MTKKVRLRCEKVVWLRHAGVAPPQGYRSRSWGSVLVSGGIKYIYIYIYIYIRGYI